MKTVHPSISAIGKTESRKSINCDDNLSDNEERIEIAKIDLEPAVDEYEEPKANVRFNKNKKLF